MKIREIGTELFHADGKTDKTKLIVVLRNFANAPESDGLLWIRWIEKLQVKAAGNRGEHWRDFWMWETEMGQQVAQLHES